MFCPLSQADVNIKSFEKKILDKQPPFEILFYFIYVMNNFIIIIYNTVVFNCNKDRFPLPPPPLVRDLVAEPQSSRERPKITWESSILQGLSSYIFSIYPATKLRRCHRRRGDYEAVVYHRDVTYRTRVVVDCTENVLTAQCLSIHLLIVTYLPIYYT